LCHRKAAPKNPEKPRFRLKNNVGLDEDPWTPCALFGQPPPLPQSECAAAQRARPLWTGLILRLEYGMALT
jgi:hypothetical protein